jgi:hypothetical protein
MSLKDQGCSRRRVVVDAIESGVLWLRRID